MLMSLGLFTFGIETLAHDELRRRSTWRHATSGRIGARDAVQFVGPGEESVSLPGTVFLEIADGRVSLDELRRMADSGETWALVDGQGYVYGAFVITSIDETAKHFHVDGTPRQIDFCLELLRADGEAEPERGV